MTDENVLPSFESMMKSKRFNSHAQDDDYQRYDYENNPAKKAQEKAKLKAKKRAYDKKHEGEPKPNLSKYSENKVRHSKAEYGKVPDKDELDDEHTPKTKDQKTAEYIARFQQSLPSFEEMMTGDAFAKVGTFNDRHRGAPKSNEELTAEASPKANEKRAKLVGTDAGYRNAVPNAKRGRVQLGVYPRQKMKNSNAGLDPTMTAAYIAKLKRNGILGNLMEAGGRHRVRDPLGRGYTINQDGGIRVDEMTTAERYDNYEDLIENWGRFTRENPGLMEAYMTEEDPVRQQVAKERLFAEWDRFKAQTEEEKMRDFTNRVRERHADALPGWMAERYPDVDISQGIPDEYVQAYANEQMYGRDVTDSEGNVTHIDGHYNMLDRYNDAFERLIAENPDMDVKEAMAQARAESGLPEVTWRDKWWKGYDEKAEEAALAQNELENKENAQWLRNKNRFAEQLIAKYKKEQEKAGTPIPEQIPPDVMKDFEAKARSQLEGMSFASDMDYDVALQNIIRDFADKYRQEEHVAENTTLPSKIIDEIYGYYTKGPDGKMVYVPGEADKMADEEQAKRAAEQKERLEAVQATRAHLDEQREAQEEATKAIDTIDRNMETAAETDARLKRKQQKDDSDRAQDLKRLMEIKGGNKSWIRDRFDDKSSELKELQDLAAKYGNEAELKDAFTDDWVTGSRGMESNWKFSKPLNKLSSFLSKPADAQDLADAQAASAAQSEYDKTQNAKKQLGGKAVEDVKYKGNIVGKVTRPAQDKDILNRKALNEKDKKEQSDAAHDKHNQERDEAKKKEAENMEDKTEEFKESTTPAFSDMLNDAFAKNHGPANRYPPMTNAQVMRDPYMRVDMRSDESEPINKMKIYDPEVITNGEGISVKSESDVGSSIRKFDEMMAEARPDVYFAKTNGTGIDDEADRQS